MPRTPLRSLQALEPINEAAFSAVVDIRQRRGSLARRAMAGHCGEPTSAVPPTADPVDLLGLASAVKQVNAGGGADAQGAMAQLATQVRQASEQLSTRGDVTAAQKSDIEQVWQAIVQMERLANEAAKAK